MNKLFLILLIFILIIFLQYKNNYEYYDTDCDKQSYNIDETYNKELNKEINDEINNSKICVNKQIIDVNIDRNNKEILGFGPNVPFISKDVDTKDTKDKDQQFCNGKCFYGIYPYNSEGPCNNLNKNQCDKVWWMSGDVLSGSSPHIEIGHDCRFNKSTNKCIKGGTSWHTIKRCSKKICNVKDFMPEKIHKYEPLPIGPTPIEGECGSECNTDTDCKSSCIKCVAMGSELEQKKICMRPEPDPPTPPPPEPPPEPQPEPPPEPSPAPPKPAGVCCVNSDTGTHQSTSSCSMIKDSDNCNKNYSCNWLEVGPCPTPRCVSSSAKPGDCSPWIDGDINGPYNLDCDCGGWTDTTLVRNKYGSPGNQNYWRCCKNK